MSNQNRSGFSERVMALALVWALGLVAALMLPLQLIPEGHSTSICGPWGCGPSAGAVATWHCFWFVLLIFPTTLICNFVPRKALRWLGGTLVVFGLLVFVSIVWWETTRWLPVMPKGHEKYLQNRIFFVIGLCGVPWENPLPKELILPVIPLLPISQIFLMGIGTLTFGIFFKKKSQTVVETETYSTMTDSKMAEQLNADEIDSDSQEEMKHVANVTRSDTYP